MIATKSKPTAKRFKHATPTGIWCTIMSNTMNTKKTTTLAQIIIEDGNTKISGADDTACEPHIISTGPTTVDKKYSKKKSRKKRRKNMQKKKALARAKIKTKVLRHGNSKNGINHQDTYTI